MKDYRLEDLIDIQLLQELQDKLNVIYSFPSAIIDNDGKILTAVAWQDLCTKFHRANPVCEKECIKSDKYILAHLHEANPAVSYQCPHGLVDNATPIIIDGKHLGNFFTGQFFLEKPDLEFFKKQAKKYGFDEKAYMEAVEKVPIWTTEKRAQYLDFIKGFIEIIASIGLNNLKEIETNKALKESIKRNQTILQTAMDGFWLTDMHGRLLEVNETYCRMSGYSKEELLQMSIFDLEAIKTIENTSAHIQSIIEKGEDRFVSKHCRKDNSIFDVEISVHYQHEFDGQFVVFLRDITQQKKAEQALIESREKFSKIFDMAPVLISITDINSGVYLDVNEYALSFSGFSKEEVIGHKSTEIGWISTENRKLLLDTLIKKGRIEGLELPFKTKTGKEVYGIINGEKIILDNKECFLTITTDVTERKQIESLLQERKKEIEVQNEEYKQLNEELQIAKEKTEESEHRLKLATISGKLGIWDLNVKENKMVWDETMFNLYGIEQDAFPNNIDAWTNGLHPEDKQRAIDECNAALNGEKDFNTSFRINRPDGTVLHLKADGLVIKDAENKPYRMIGINSDITELKHDEIELIKAKERAEESEKTWQTTFDAITDFVMLLDTKHGIININKAGLDALHKPLNEVIGKKCFNLVHNQNCPIQECPCEISLNEKRIVVNEYTENNKIYELTAWLVFDVNNEIKAFTHIVKDITERKQAEEKIREKDIQFRKLSANVHDLIYQFTRKPDGAYCVPIASEGIKNIFGCSPEDVVDDFAPIGRVIFPDDVAKVINDIEYSAEHLTYFTCEFRVQIPGKEIQWIYSKSTPEKLPDGSITWYGFNADITERKQAEFLLQEKNEEYEALNEELTQSYNELKSAKEKAEESDRLKSNFLNNMSHEVRTPLNAIVGFSQIMTKPNQPLEKLQKFSNLITTNSNKLIGIITDVIEISQIQANLIQAKLAEIDILSFVNNSVKSFIEIAKEKNLNLVLNMRIPFKEYFVLTDIEKLNKTLNHLIDNALKFTTKGSVEIICALVETHGHEHINISITDTGIGISEELQKKIFEPFHQVETGITRDYGGNGLGLSIVKAYIELIKGTISLKSELNKGTTVTVSIPVIKSNKQIVQKEKNKPSHALNTILIAEDEYSNYQYLLELLSETGIEILYAANGQEAVDICKTNASVDLILMDIKMPIMDGHKAAKLIKLIRPELPIIAQTAFALENEKEQFSGVFDDWISKPINEDELKQGLKRYTDKL